MKARHVGRSTHASMDEVTFPPMVSAVDHEAAGPGAIRIELPARVGTEPIAHVLAPYGSPDRSPPVQRGPKNEREIRAMDRAIRVAEIGGRS